MQRSVPFCAADPVPGAGGGTGKSVQYGFHRVPAAETAHYHDGTVNAFCHPFCGRRKIAFIHMRFDTADGSAVAADFNGIDACVCKKSADGDTFFVVQSILYKITAVDFYAYVQIRCSFPYTCQNLQQDTAAVFCGAAVGIGPVVYGAADKTAQEKEMRCVNLYTVETCLFRADGRLDKLADNMMDFLFFHVVGFHLLEAPTGQWAVIRAQGQLGKDRTAFFMDDVRQRFVLGNQRVVGEAHHAAEIKVIGGNTGEAGDDGAHSALSQFFIDGIGPGGYAAIRIGDAFPGGRADKTVSQSDVFQFDWFK